MLEQRCYFYIYIFIYRNVIFSVLKCYQCKIFVSHLEATVLNAIKIPTLIRLYVADRPKI